MKVQIIGAGSAGTHIARACIRDGHTVSIWDKDINAKDRFLDLYRERYGLEADVDCCMSYDADLYIICTPPDTHLSVYKDLRKDAKVLIEKPLCLPIELSEFDNVSVNYNHLYAPEYLRLKELPKPQYIEVFWQESKDFIMAAHPWLRFEDSYLSDFKRGGGSAYEHSHGLAAALGLFPNLEYEEISKISVVKQYENKYDIYMKIRFFCRGVIVTVITDFVQRPAKKEIVLHYQDKIVRSDLGIPNTERNDQFLYGLRGALQPNDSFNIGKMCVKLIGECHDRRY